MTKYERARPILFIPPNISAPEPNLPVTRLVAAAIKGLNAYDFYPANAAVVETTPEMMYGVSAKPPVAIPQPYIRRGIRTRQIPTGRGGTPTVITGRV